MSRPIMAGEVAGLLNSYMRGYEFERWKVHFSPDPTRDGYVLMLQLIRDARDGDMFAKRFISRLETIWVRETDVFCQHLADHMDEMRVEIIEQLDEQLRNKAVKNDLATTKGRRKAASKTDPTKARAQVPSVHTAADSPF